MSKQSIGVLEISWRSKDEYDEYFLFFQNTSNNSVSELVLDSGATNHTFKVDSLFIQIDKEYTGTIANASGSENFIEGRDN